MSKIVHFEIPVDDADRATAFYSDVLDWQVTKADMGEAAYWLVRAGADEEPGANGALVERDGLHPYPVVVVGVADLEKTLVRVAECGGRVLQGKLPIPGVGWFAYAGDTEGNVIGVFQPEGGVPAG